MAETEEPEENGVNNNVDEDLQEIEHFNRIVNAYKYYSIHSRKRVQLAAKYFHELPQHHQQMLPNYENHLKKLCKCIDANYEIIQLIIAHTENMFQNKGNVPLNDRIQVAREFDMVKVKTTLKQIVRDWSADGSVERDTCYGPVIREIQQRFPTDKYNRGELSVLVPGAGLGRLAYDIAKLGFQCQGNEFSLFMLFASNFILNRCHEVNMLTVYPWISEYCNNKTSAGQVQPVHFPDVNPADIPPTSDFSMAAGDFLDVYKNANSWDCVASVYFIDTAHNIVAYIESIFHILKPGGYWINFGPLLYHFADLANESSIELSWEEVREVIKKFNFEILKEEVNIRSTYTQNPASMLQHQYDCVFLVARKPLNPR